MVTPARRRRINLGYECWGSMKARCLRKSNNQFKEYGAKGITIDEKWMTSKGFFEDMGYRPTPQHSIDRIDNSKGYFKENCRWATKKEQVANRRISYECHQGHPWTEESTMFLGTKKSKRCRICYEARMNENKRALNLKQEGEG